MADQPSWTAVPSRQAATDRDSSDTIVGTAEFAGARDLLGQG
jgi:hypothetical protein